jgi:hypothetical protein
MFSAALANVIAHSFVAGQSVGCRAALRLIVEVAERLPGRVVTQSSATEVALVGTSHTSAASGLSLSGWGADFRIWRFLVHSRENAGRCDLHGEC